MSMSSHVAAIRPPDAKWRAMKTVFDSCAAAGVPVPKEVELFFNGERPDEAGVVIDLYRHEAVREYKTAGGSGFEVDLAKLPPDVTVLRFVNRW